MPTVSAIGFKWDVLLVQLITSGYIWAMGNGTMGDGRVHDGETL